MQKKKIKISKKRYAQMMRYVELIWNCCDAAGAFVDQFAKFLTRTMKMDPQLAHMVAGGWRSRDAAMQAIAKRFTVD